MANGPLGGNMGTPPVPPQPPQVSFETTAQSRGNFNNFLKSMPNTTAMTPIPPMGSPSMMSAPNPMSNIDIFNPPQNYLSGGLVQFGNDLMRGLAEPVNQKTRNIHPFLEVVEDSAQQRFGVDLSGLAPPSENPFSPAGGESIFQGEKAPDGMGISSNPDSIFDNNNDLSGTNSTFKPNETGVQLSYMQMDPDGDGFDTFGKPMRETTSSGGGMTLGDSKKLFNDAFTEGASSSSSSAFGGGDSRVAGQTAGLSALGSMPSLFYNGGYVDDFEDDDISFDTTDPSIGIDSSFNEDNFQDALDNLDLGSDAPSDDSMFSDDPAIVDRRGVNVGIENTGGFTTGVVPNLRGERFTRFETPDYALRALGRDFRTKVNKNPIENLMQGKDPYLTVGDYFETFTPSSENPGGTGNRVAEFTKATGKGADDILSLNDMNNIMDIQAKYEAGIRNTPAGRIEKIATTVPMNNDRQIATVLAGLDLKNALTLDNKTPTGVAPVGTQGAGSRGDTIQVQDSNVIGSTDAELAALNRAINNTQIVTDREKQLANVNDQTLADRLQLQRGLDKPLDTTTPDTALETMAGRRDILPDTRYDIDTSFIDRNFVGDDFQPALDFIDNREPDLDALRSDRATYDTIYDPETYTGPDIKGYGTKIGGTASGEELDQAPFQGRSPGSLQAQFGDRIGPMIAGLNQNRQDALGDLSQQRDTFGGILNALGIKSPNQRMINALSSGQGSRLFGGTYEPTPIYQDGRIVGVRDQYGNLMEGRDPFAPDTGSNENEDPLILRPIAKAKEEEKEEKDDTPPNIIGGGDGDVGIPTPPKSVVVDSPFTSNVGKYTPVGFDGGDLNALIAQLLKTSNPKSMKRGGVAQFQNGGRVDQALDRFLATA